jgi:hypothetical protein
MTARQKIGNLVEPKAREDRERRPIPGLEDTFEVTRTGLVWSVEGESWEEPHVWPYLKLLSDDQLIELNLVEAVAVSWLTFEQRQELRATFQGADATEYRKPWTAELLEAEQRLQVYIYAVAAVANTASDDEFSHWSRVNPERPDITHATAVNDVTVEYGSRLFENYRPPSKGGNTTALHVHWLKHDGYSYSFFALGAKKWVFAGDTVSFRYTTTPEGYRNIIRESIVVKDKEGKVVVRGNRGYKKTLRTATARLPVSRREARD